MFTKTALLLFLLLTLGIACARPLTRDTGRATLKFSTRINTDGFPNLIEKDRARVRAMAEFHHLDKRSPGPPMTLSAMNAGVYYTADVGIGTPPKYSTLLLDTGSSNTWIAQDYYVPSNSSVDTGDVFFIVYGPAFAIGEEYLDTVTLNPNLVIQQQSIGIANETVDLHGFQGMLGLGPIDLTEKTVSDQDLVPTVLDNLYYQGNISQIVLGVSLTPATGPEGNGELMFGCIDDSALTSPVNYIPITNSYPASKFWGIDQSMSYGNITILPVGAGIVDSGTTFILVATDAFLTYQNMTGGILDSATGLLMITASQYADLETLTFYNGDSSFDLIPNAQIWPRTLNTFIGGTWGAIYLVVADIGFPGGLFFQFVTGYTFMERYYSVFDEGTPQLGFAETNYTYALTN